MKNEKIKEKAIRPHGKRMRVIGQEGENAEGVVFLKGSWGWFLEGCGKHFPVGGGGKLK